MNFKSLFSIASLVVFFSACNNRVEVTETGLKYQIHENNEGKKGKIGDIVTFHLQLKTDRDSTLRDTHKEGHPLQIMLQTPPFKGSFEEGLAMLTKGDSATFFVNADSLFTKMGGQMPPYIKKGSDVTFIVKILNIQNEQEFNKDAAEARKKQLDVDQKVIEAYIAKNGLKTTKTASGLHYITQVAGSGPTITPGNTATVLYTGKLLNGTVFDSSEKQGGKPAEFQIGVGMVIPGWDEGIQTMRKGGKSTFIIPSSLGYGEQGAPGVIPPNSVLLFDVELKDVKAPSAAGK